MEAEFKAIEALIGSRQCWTDLSDPLEGTPVGSASKGRLRAEIDSTKKGRISCLLDLLKVRQRQSVGGIPLTVEVKFEFSSEVFD